MTINFQQKSFFSRFKRRLRHLSKVDPGGRYFSILLEQVFLEDPETFGALVFPEIPSKRFKLARASTEFRYRKPEVSAKKARSADFAIHDHNGDLLALVEVKENDQLTPGNQDQTTDYLSFISEARQEGQTISFAYITKHLPAASTLEMLNHENICPLYYNQIYNRLTARMRARKQVSISPVATLFCRYLEEEGVVYQQLTPDDLLTLKLLIRSSVNLNARIGTGKSLTAERMTKTPDILKLILANVESLGIRFHQLYRQNFGNRFLPRFNFCARATPRKIIAAVKGTEEEDNVPFDVDPREFATSASMYVWSQGILKNSSNCYVWIGFRFELGVDSKAPILAEYYCGVGLYDDEDDKPISKRSFPSEDEALRNLSQLLAGLIQYVENREARGRSAVERKYSKNSLKALRSLKEDLLSGVH